MKFCDKLAKQRKNNNMSQEQLADRLGVSRQAVSKWESGTSMPDMEKIMQLCKILNCSLDDLVDDAACGNAKIPEQKVGISTYLQEILDFITKTFNMFWSMRFVEKIKCILEMLFILLIIYILWAIIGQIIYQVFEGLIYMLPNNASRIIYHLCSVIYKIIGLITGAIIFIHIFKIRYLDYFVTIEDDTTKDKKIEKPVDEEKNDEERNFIEHKKNKIIIRDPKHSTYNFFNVLAKFIVWVIKFILLFVLFLAIICLIFLTFSTTVSIWLLKNGIFFLGTTIILIGCIIINYIILKIIYNFILDQKQNIKTIFRVFIIGILLAGIGLGISFCTYLTFNKTDYVANTNYTTQTFTINEIEDNTVLQFIDYNITELVEDDTTKGISIEFTYNEEGEIDFYNYTTTNNYYDTVYHSIETNVYDYDYLGEDNDLDTFKTLIESIKNKARIDNYELVEVSKIKITASKSTLDKLKKNYEEYNW